MLVDVYLVQDPGGAGSCERLLVAVEHQGPETTALVKSLSAFINLEDMGYEDGAGLMLGEANGPTTEAGFPQSIVGHLVENAAHDGFEWVLAESV